MIKIEYPMNGISPPTIDTLAALVRLRFIQYMRFAIADLRGGDWRRAAFFLGVASGQVSALYDINYSGSYALLSMVNRLERIAGSRDNG